MRFTTTYTDLDSCLYSLNEPTPVRDPKMLILNEDLAHSIGFDLSQLEAKELVDLFAGNSFPAECVPFSQAYAGHQFGHFTMLGDGRAHIVTEHLSPQGERFDIQLKGSGKTRYSRRGDGRAVLGPMLREYLISEALFHLGIPTTRSLAVVSTGEQVMRETALPGAILTRVASSHIRVGTFEYAARFNRPEVVSSLLEYTIKRHYPEIALEENQASLFLQAVMQRQLELVLHWVRVGFIHGVMNTDNMALSGESIDFGPCAFMDGFNSNQVFSSIDQHGRYAYANQPRIVPWNLARLAESLLPCLHEENQKAVAIAEEIMQQYGSLYRDQWLAMMRAKLGLLDERAEDEQLISDLLSWMQRYHADYTNTFRDLSLGLKLDSPLYNEESFSQWYQRYQLRLSQSGHNLEDICQSMCRVNPEIIPRNHQVENALGAATQGDLSPFLHLLEAMKVPYETRKTREDFKLPPAATEQIYQTYCGT